MTHWFVFMVSGDHWVRTHGPYATPERARMIARGYAGCTTMIALDRLVDGS